MEADSPKDLFGLFLYDRFDGDSKNNRGISEYRTETLVKAKSYLYADWRMQENNI